MRDDERYRNGMSAYHRQHYAEAIELLEPVASRRRGPRMLLSRFYVGQSHYHLGLQLFEQGRFSEATIHFGFAVQANPNGMNVARYLAACYARTGRTDLAVRELECRLADCPADSGTRIRLALMQWQQGLTVEAASLLREGLRVSPDHAELHYQLGVWTAAEGELDEAERLFERALALDPAHARACERLAQCSGAKGLRDAALCYLQRAQQLDPSNGGVSLQLSILSQGVGSGGVHPVVRLRRPPLAAGLDEPDLERLGEAIVAEPDFVRALISIPATDTDDEVFSVLAATLERALLKYPEFADLHYHCGEVYRRLDQKGKAIKHAERAVEINPRYVEALILLAWLYRQTDQRAAGIERLRQAIAAGGDYPDVHYLIGRLYQDGHELDRARRAYGRALELNSRYREAREALEALSY